MEKFLRQDDFVRNDGVEGILQDVHFTSAQNGWAVGHGSLVLRTVDGGNTWMKLEIELEPRHRLLECLLLR